MSESNVEMFVLELGQPTEVVHFEKGREEVFDTPVGRIRRRILEPGFSWSIHVGAGQGKSWCDQTHFHVHLAGRFEFRTRDGRTFEAGPSYVSYVRPGHDGRVVGEDTVVLVDLGDLVAESPGGS